jgi:hypothetical protein
MTKHRSRISESDVEVAERAGDLVGAIDTKLTASSHARSVPLDREVEDALIAAEIALRNVLTGS